MIVHTFNNQIILVLHKQKVTEIKLIFSHVHFLFVPDLKDISDIYIAIIFVL